jgi:dTMP kinase
VTRGLLISFEGGDGAGKSTQSAALAAWLADQGRTVRRTYEPGDTPLGAVLRRAVQHGEDVSPRTEALLYAADRAHHVDTLVRPALDAGTDVIVDRYLDSSVAYQGVGRGLGTDEIERLSRWATEGLMPDLTVLLDIDPAVGLSRLLGDPDRLERAGDEFHRRVRSAYLARAEADPDRFLVLDATRRADDLTTEIRRRVQSML